MNATLRWLARIRDICLLRAGPQDLPYAPRLLVVLLVAGAIVEAAFDLGRGAAVRLVIAANLGTLAALGVLSLLLRWRRKPERFVQTTLALLATSLLFEVAVLPLLLVVGQPTDPKSVTGTQMIAGLVLFALVVWLAGIGANILRQALEIPLAGGVLVLLLTGFADLFAAALAAALLGA